MSLSTIAQTLKDIENGTPRRLVDQLLMAKKQMKKLPDSQLENLTSDTYTLLMPSSRNSLPVCPSTIKKFDEQTMRNSKLSLDSKLISDTSTLNHQNVSRHSAEPAASQVDSSFPEILSEKLRVSNSSTVNLTGTPSQSTGKCIEIQFQYFFYFTQGKLFFSWNFCLDFYVRTRKTM